MLLLICLCPFSAPNASVFLLFSSSSPRFSFLLTSALLISLLLRLHICFLLIMYLYISLPLGLWTTRSKLFLINKLRQIHHHKPTKNNDDAIYGRRNVGHTPEEIPRKDFVSGLITSVFPSYATSYDTTQHINVAVWDCTIFPAALSFALLYARLPRRAGITAGRAKRT